MYREDEVITTRRYRFYFRTSCYLHEITNALQYTVERKQFRCITKLVSGQPRESHAHTFIASCA